MSTYLAIFNSSGIECSESGAYVLTNPPTLAGTVLTFQGDATVFDIAGPNTTQPYLKWFQLESYLFNVRSSNVSSSSEFVAFLQPSEHSPRLVAACATKRALPYVRVEISVGQTTSNKRLAVTMIDATMVDFRGTTGTAQSGAAGTNTTTPLERYTFQFKRCQWGYVDGALVERAEPVFRIS